MESTSATGLRSRSRSKTPFLRSSCDRESCTEGEEHTHVSGRKTPIKRSSQTRQLKSSTSKKVESIQEEDERGVVPPAHRTRQATRTIEKVIKTSDYSSDENVSQYKEDMLQSTQYDNLSARRHETFADFSLSPIQHVLSQQRRASRPASPAYSSHSNCSTASSFAQQALADTTVLLTQDPTTDHLPYRLYKMAGEYWNKYPKTDYTYSSLSKDRVELAPGQVAVPNMSRPSLAQARLGRPTTSADETDDSLYTYSRRSRFNADCSDDEVSGNGGYHYRKETSRWNNNHSPYKYDRYPYRRNEPGIFRRAATSTGALFYWIYTFTKTVVTTTVTTVTETLSPTRIIEKYHHYSSSHRRSTGGPWSKWLLLLLLLPVLGYGCYNYDVLPPPTTVPNQESVIATSYKDLEIIGQLVKRIEDLERQQKDNSYIDEKLQSLHNQYVTKEELNTFSQMFSKSEERVRQIIEEYIRVREITIERESVGEGFDEEAVKRVVAKMLEVYDADKIGMVDYALESAGGQVLSTKCTELYQIKTKQYSILGVPVWWGHTSPRYALTPGNMPAECWAFQGFPGYLVVKTFAPIEVTGFTIEHMSKLLASDGKIESAPKNFSVYGLHDETDTEPHHFGDYIYNTDGPPIQYFSVQKPKITIIEGREIPLAYDIMELRIESNHGHPVYTCLYRFRVHGNPLDKISKSS